jgi:hypothetical protein
MILVHQSLVNRINPLGAPLGNIGQLRGYIRIQRLMAKIQKITML